MVISEKMKGYLIGALWLAIIVFLVHSIGQIILPFVFALFIAYLINPLVIKIQKKIPNRNVALSTLLTAISILVLGVLIFFGTYFVKDTKRLVGAVDVFVEQHEEQITEIRKNVGSFIDGIYESDAVQTQLHTMDTTSSEVKEKNVMSAIEKAYSFLSGPETKTKEPETNSWNGFLMFINTVIYAVTILYTYDYFQKIYARYTKDRIPINAHFQNLWDDFQRVFLVYFRQRAKVVLIGMAIFILAFSIMDLPGAIILGILTGLLTYAAHFHYFTLPLVAIGCWVLSIETSLPFLLFFGIVMVVYILVSVLEETVFFQRIMKSVNGMNPAIMILAFILWIYLLGGFVGTILALPLTRLILIYLDRLMMYTKDRV